MTADVTFDGKKCGHTDMYPCLADFGEPWLRYEVFLCDAVCVMCCVMLFCVMLFMFAVFGFLCPCR